MISIKAYNTETDFYNDICNPLYSLCSEIMIKTGLRVSDVLELKFGDIKSYRPYIKERKTGKRRRVYLSRGIMQAIQLHKAMFNLEDNDYIFTWEHGGKHIHRSTIYRCWKTTAKEKLGDSDNISPHSARKIYAHNLLRKGKSPREIQRILKHSNIGTTIVSYLQERELDENRKGGNK